MSGSEHVGDASIARRVALQDAVEGWLKRVAEAEDPAEILDPGAEEAGRRLAALVHDGDDDVTSHLLMGWLHWYRHLALRAGADEQDLRAAVEWFLLCFVDGVRPLPEPLLPMLGNEARSLAVELLQRAMVSPDPGLVDATVQLWRRVLAATRIDDVDLGARLSNLAAALQIRFQRAGIPADLDEAIELSRKAVAATAVDDRNVGAYLSNLGGALRTRFERTGTLADLDEAIVVNQQAVAATHADHPDPGAG